MTVTDIDSIYGHTEEPGLPVNLRQALIDPRTLDGKAVPHREWLVEGMIPMHNVTQLSGDGGLGKSQIALQLAIAMSMGKDWLGMPTTPGRALCIFAEDDEDELHRRMAATLEHLGAGFADLGNLRLMCRVGLDNAMMTFEGGYGPGEETAFAGTVMDTAVQFGAKLVVVDSLHDVFAGNENSRLQARQFIGLLRTIATETRGAVLLNAHPSLSGRNTGTGEAGSTAWHNSVRSRLYLTQPDDTEPDARVLKGMKANYGPRNTGLDLVWRNGLFIRPPSDDGTVFAGIKQSRAETSFLDCLDALTTQKRHLSPSPNSPNFAPKAMVAGGMVKGFKVRDLRAAMEKLFAKGTIEVVEYGRKTDPRQKIVRSGVS